MGFFFFFVFCLFILGHTPRGAQMILLAMHSGIDSSSGGQGTIAMPQIKLSLVTCKSSAFTISLAQF